VPEVCVRREPDLVRGECWDFWRHIHLLL
jgi:hypothetical protein